MWNRLCESLPILVFRLAPLHLAQCGHTWEEHVLEMVFSLYVLCPDICLDTEDMRLFLLCHLLGIWLIAVYHVYRNESADAERLVVDVK